MKLQFVHVRLDAPIDHAVNRVGRPDVMYKTHALDFYADGRVKGHGKTTDPTVRDNGLTKWYFLRGEQARPLWAAAVVAGVLPPGFEKLS